MARDLRACLARGDLSGSVIARAATRLMVLPFRMLRPDPAIDFLAFSLPEAITVSLSGLESLIVRSSLAASRYSADQPDLRALASEAGVDAVVTGSLLQSSGLVRVSVQLVEVPSGTLLWSHAAQVPVDDMFQIQDAVCSAVVEALALPLSSREQRLLRRDVPASSEAYGHYLRANRLSASSSQWLGAIESYQRAVEADPSYAPAWARFGRCLRVVSKYGSAPEAMEWLDQAEEALAAGIPHQPGSVVGASSLYAFRSRCGPVARGHGAAARTRSRMQQRSGAVRGAAARLSLRRPARCVDCRVPAGDAAGSRDSHQRRPFVLHDRRLRTGHRARRRRPGVPHRRSRCMPSDDRTRRWTCVDWRTSGVRPTSSSSC